VTEATPTASARRFSRALLLWTALAWACLLTGPVGAAAETPSDAERIHEQAVELARAGDFDAALSLLTPLAEAPDAPLAVRYDHATILGWAGRDAEALQAAARFPWNTAPPWALEVVAEAARHLERHADAVRAYELAVRGEPSRIGLRIGLALSRAEGGDVARARAELNDLDARYPEPRPEAAEVARALADVAEMEGDLAVTLSQLQQTLERHPEDREARRRLIFLSADLGAPQRAAELAQAAPPGLLSADDRARLRAAQADALLEWGVTVDPENPAEPYRDVDRALALLDENLQAARRTGGVEAERDARLARIPALVARGRPAEAIAGFTALAGRAQGAADDEAATPPVPPQVLEAAGDAWRDLRQPRRAIPLYQAAADAGADPFDMRLKLVYAHSEAHHGRRAVAEGRKLVADYPALVTRDGRPVPGWRHQEALLALTVAQADAGHPQAARRRLAALHRAAPGNAEVATRLAVAERNQGWPHQSLTTSRTALSLYPTDAGLREVEAYALLDLRRYRTARARSGEFFRLYPASTGAARLARDIDTGARPELTLTAVRRTSSGVALGSSGLDIDARLYSQRLRDAWRVFVHSAVGQARFSGSRSTLRRAGAGLELARADLLGSVELHTDHYSGGGRSGNQGGAELEAEYRAGDHWWLNAGLDTFSADTPLQALEAGVRAWSGNAGVRWQPLERRALSAGIARMEFSDGNRRDAHRAVWREGWIGGPVWHLGTELELSRSRNTLTGAPYYNPSSDRTLSLSVSSRWGIALTPGRAWERSLDHGFTLSGGRYAQSGFVTQNTWRVGYDQLWQVSDRLNLGWGIALGRAVYDGSRETEREAFITLDRRF